MFGRATIIKPDARNAVSGAVKCSSEMYSLYNHSSAATQHIGRQLIARHKLNVGQSYYFKIKLKCGPMPNLMVALLNIGSALCSTPQSLADAHY